MLSSEALAIARDEMTIVIEWENPIDVDEEWPRASARALADELGRYGGGAAGRPTVLYLYDATVIERAEIEAVLHEVAPDLGERARVDFAPTEGLTYYALKNRGARLAETELVVLLDSDSMPQPGWLAGLVAPFADPEIMVTGGATSLVAQDLVSRAMALCWIFDLPSEHASRPDRMTLHVNNCAIRTAFFRENPFPATEAFKKQCGIWLADVRRRGFGFVRATDALCLHAPHSGLRFVLWRGMQSGFDRDAKAMLEGRGRLVRAGHALRVYLKKLWRSSRRIVAHRREVALSAAMIPGALAVAWLYFSAVFVGQACSVSMNGAPERLRLRVGASV